MGQEPHVSDEELILALDGELDEPRATDVSRHLAHCWECRGRRSRFERGIEEYMDAHRTAAEALVIPPAEGPAAKLRANLRQLSSHQEPEARWQAAWFPSWLGARPSLLAGALVMLLAPLATLWWLSIGRAQAPGPLPDARLTPGAVRAISQSQVCRVVPEDEGRMVPAQLAQRVFERYRIANPKPRSYEVDYLISPALGGAPVIQNLWPVPYAEGEWTSRVKDALEDHLRTLVCEGTLDLATAQHEISTNWIAAYQKHFRTKKPVASHALFVKDSPWE